MNYGEQIKSNKHHSRASYAHININEKLSIIIPILLYFRISLTDVPVRVSGKVSIDVNGIAMPESDLQAYVATMDGRVYMAISDVPTNLGFELQYLSVFPSVVAWLFSLHSENAYNGYQLTG